MMRIVLLVSIWLAGAGLIYFWLPSVANRLDPRVPARELPLVQPVSGTRITAVEVRAARFGSEASSLVASSVAAAYPQSVPAAGRLVTGSLPYGSTQARVPSRSTMSEGIERELRRLGCLREQPSGRWTASVRSALASFIGRVNAKLPVEAPHTAHLSLLRAYESGSCGAPVLIGSTSPVTPVARQAVEAGRMSLGVDLPNARVPFETHSSLKPDRVKRMRRRAQSAQQTKRHAGDRALEDFFLHPLGRR